jgi:hypothetical protein
VADGDLTKELLIAAGTGTRHCSETGLGDAQGDNSKRHLSAALIVGSSGGTRQKAERRNGEQSGERREARRINGAGIRQAVGRRTWVSGHRWQLVLRCSAL